MSVTHLSKKIDYEFPAKAIGNDASPTVSRVFELPNTVMFDFPHRLQIRAGDLAGFATQPITQRIRLAGHVRATIAARNLEVLP